MKKSIVLILVSLFATVAANAVTRHVPSEYSTIQSALNASQTSDTVLVDDGVYTGTINWPQVNRIVLTSVNGNEASFLDGNFAGPVVNMNGNVAKLTATIKGFTIQNGLTRANPANGFVAGGSGISLFNMTLNLNFCNLTTNRITGDAANFSYCNGSAISAESSKLLITDCSFTQNSIDSTYTIFGGVIYTGNSQLSLTRSNFDSNTILSTGNIQGGVVAATFGQILIKNVSVTQNEINISGNGSIVGGAYYFQGDGTSQLTNALIANNTLISTNTIQGGGIWSSLFLSVIHCTIAGNHYQSGSGVGGNSISLTSYLSSTPKLKVINSILWNPEGSTFEMAFVGAPSVTYSDVLNGFSGSGNTASDPLFVSGKDFHLQNTSPCVDRSALAANPPTDLDGNARPMPVGTKADLGCYEVNQSLRMENASNEVNPITAVQIYPNPVHQTANLSFLLKEESKVTVTVLDFSGRMMKEVMNETLASGAHNVVLNSDKLTTGDYFVQMQIGDKIFSQKITVD